MENICRPLMQRTLACRDISVITFLPNPARLWKTKSIGSPALRRWYANRSKRQAYTPELFIERTDGTEERIQEEDLYRYTRRRWVFNERYERSRHSLRFNLRELLRLAVDIVGNGARSCVKVVKRIEGLHNKGLLLTMDNGAEVFAKLPNPNAGPAHYTTASEVATREFLREVFEIPVPRVFTWCSDSRNPVGAEYIIEEKAPGVRLGNLWGQWPRQEKLKIIRQVVEMERKLMSVNFEKHGALYYQEDIRGTPGNFTGLSRDASVAPDILERYAIGPATSAEIWKGERAYMDFDRGPWKTSSDYAQAMGLNEISWIKLHAVPQMNYYRSTKTPEYPEEARSLLSKYTDAAPYFISQDVEEKPTVLWHPDLHRDNVFVDPETYEITSIIDWQSAAVAPLFFQCGVPRMFQHAGQVREGWVIPERPENFDTLGEEEKMSVDDDLESETMQKYYEAQTYKLAPRHWRFLQEKAVPKIREPVGLVTGVWENRDLFFLRQSLISLAAHWDELFPDKARECPLTFTEQELKLHSDEAENVDGIGKLLAIFQEEGVFPVDGMVDPEDYDAAMESVQKYKDVFLGLAKDEEERELFSKLWPYQDTKN